MTETVKTIATGIGAFIGIMGMAIVLIAIFTYPTMWLWNYLMPNIFNLPELTFWQTFGLMILARLILPTTSKSTKSN
jgi:hypothetical protein